MKTTHMKIRTSLKNLIFAVSAALALAFLASDARAQCGPIDIAFVIDDTGSMSAALYSFRAELPGILDAIEASSKGDYRAALVTFKNDVTVRVPLAAANRAAIISAAATLSAAGGGDVPEASDEAINTVVNGLAATGRSQTGNFTPAMRTNAYKIIVVITDAPPGGFADAYTAGVTDVRAHNYAVQAAYKGIRIVANYVPNSADNTPTAKPVLQDYATTTGGQFLQSDANGAGTLTAVNTLLATCTSGTTGGGGSGGSGLVSFSPVPSDDKPGSVLFFNFFTSDLVNSNQENTLISITNTNETNAVTVRLFWIAGDTGAVSDSYFCILPTRHINIMASDFDPGIRGYALAVAIDSTGVPINFNHLIGSEMIKMKTGHQAILGAVSYDAIDTTPAVVDATAGSATLKFDGLKYDFSPKDVVLDNFTSPLDGDQTFLIINKFGGNLGVPDFEGTITPSIGTIGNISVLMYDQSDRSYAPSITAPVNQQTGLIRDGFPRMIPNISKVITAGKLGWFRFNSTAGNSLSGSVISYNPKSMRNNGRNLRNLVMTNTATWVMSVTAPPTTCP